MSDPAAGGRGPGPRRGRRPERLQRLRSRRCARRAAMPGCAPPRGRRRRAVRRAAGRARGPPAPARRSSTRAAYRWMVGIFGLVHRARRSRLPVRQPRGGRAPGSPPGTRLRYFAAPLAATNLDGDANAHPTCSAARHDPRALNVCLMARRGPLVLSFFVTGAEPVRAPGERAADAGAAASRSVQFAAVAINALAPATAALVRAHRWTIPVAYDRDGRVGALYGVAACPMVELAARGGIVRDRLIGNRWQTAAALAPAGAGAAGRAGRPRAEAMASPAPQPGFVDPLVAAEFPGLRLRWVTRRGAPAAQPARAARPAARALQPLPGRRRGGDAHQADPAGLPRLLSPDRPGPRRAPHPVRGGGGGAPDPGRVCAPSTSSPTPAWWP